MAKAIGLLSGGIDSILACLILRQAGVEIEAISYSSFFFDADWAKRVSNAYDIPLLVLDIGEEYLEQVVKKPRYGYGSNMNPCIDCHAYMLRLAGQIMDKRGFDFLFTGEVLGQRPMSQNRQSLGIVAKASGYSERILRPLSAKVLPITFMEKIGLVDRSYLLGLTGRSRTSQIALAKKFGVKVYSPLGGGCLLTEPGFSRRLKDLISYTPQAGIDEIYYLRCGRHLRLTDRAKLIIGRSYIENQALMNLTLATVWYVLTTVRVKGPVGIYFGPLEKPEIFIAGSAVAGYSQAIFGTITEVQIKGGPLLSVMPFDRQEMRKFLL